MSVTKDSQVFHNTVTMGLKISKQTQNIHKIGSVWGSCTYRSLIGCFTTLPKNGCNGVTEIYFQFVMVLSLVDT